MDLVQVVDGILAGADFSKIQGPTIELKEGSLQTYVQIGIAHADLDRLVVRIEEHPLNLQPLASLPMGLHMEQVEIEAGDTQEDEESDSEPGEVQGRPDLGEREDSQGRDKGEEPEGEPGPTGLVAGQIDETHGPESGTCPERQPPTNPLQPHDLSQATHRHASLMRFAGPPLPRDWVLIGKRGVLPPYGWIFHSVSEGHDRRVGPARGRAGEQAHACGGRVAPVI